MVSKTDLIAKWVDENPAVGKWLNQLATSTRSNYAFRAYHYFTWLKVNGGRFARLTVAELLDLQDRAVGRARYDQLDVLQRYVNGLHLRVSSKKTVYSIIRGFYARSRVELPRDRGFVVRSDIPPRMGDPFDVEGLKRVIGVANRLYRAVFLCMFQGAMGAEELMVFNDSWNQIKPQLENGKKRLKIYLPGRKHSRNRLPYYTFIGRDGVEALKEYLEAERGAILNGEPIFLNSRHNPLTKQNIKNMFTRCGEKVGLLKRPTPPCPKCGEETLRVRRRHWVNGVKKQVTSFICKKCGKETLYSPEHAVPISIRYGVNSHELRDIFRTEWQMSQAEPVCAEFFMGHDIDPNHYNKIMKMHPEWAEEQYAKAEPFLNIVSEDPRKVSLDRVRQLEEKTREIDRLQDKITDMEKEIRNWKTVLLDFEKGLRYSMKERK